MFYSHEILTSRKHGVATIWLVATLGSKSSLKKISRKAILDVDVPKACETIADPDSPMALRLQSSLLYGVSRVFSQQCGYILTDMQGLHDKMRGACSVMRELQIDKNVAMMSSNLLNLPADPSFDFNLDMGFDFSILDISTEPSAPSSFLSPHTFDSSQSSLVIAEGPEPQLQLPSADLSVNDFYGLDFDAGLATSSIQRPVHHTVFDTEESGIDQNPVFEIGDDDMIVEKLDRQLAYGNEREQPIIPNPQSLPSLEARVIGDHAIPAATENNHGFDFDDGQMALGDDDITHLVAPPSAMIRSTPEPVASYQDIARSVSAVAPMMTVASEPTIQALQRRARPPRVVQADQITEVSNRQLSIWQEQYVAHMAQTRQEKTTKQSLHQARRNAAFWILDQGIGGAMVNLGGDRVPHPLAIFSGDALIQALTGRSISPIRRKRSHVSIEREEEDDGHDARRVRSGSYDKFIRNNDQVMQLDDEGLLLQGDDDVEMQVGRQPASSLKDYPSSMPWNLIASSRQGSIQGSVRVGMGSSVRGPRLDIGHPSVQLGRYSRMTSSSPLVGRGRLPSRLGSLDPSHSDAVPNLDTNYSTGFPSGFSVGIDEDFELYGPAAAVSTQQAAGSQWVASALENEAHNFLAFLSEKIVRQPQVDGAAMVTFANLLPPKDNSNVVAAQGLLHVLALATKGLISVHQEEDFGQISLSVVRPDEEEADDEDNHQSGEVE